MVIVLSQGKGFLGRVRLNAHTRAGDPTPIPPSPKADNQGCCLVVTTGGTGPAPRDVTPEATEAVCSRMLPGYGEQMRAISLKYVPTAVLSRQTAGRGRDLGGRGGGEGNPGGG